MEYDMILPAVTGASGVFAGCADGDYNRDLPAQYCESLNVTSRKHTEGRNRDQPTLALGNGLCQTCNLNQTLKVRALADYTPIHADNYDKEIEDYRKRLEKTYSLCRACEATLHQTLGKQDSWLKPKLISWRLKMTAENKAKLVVNSHRSYRGTSFLLHLLRFTALLISLALFLCNLHHLQRDSGNRVVELDFGLGIEQHLEALYLFLSPLVIAGLALLLLSIFGSGKEILLVSDAITSFMWVGLLALSSSKQLISNKDYNSLQVLVSGSTVLFTAWTLVVPRSVGGTKLMSKHTLNKSGVSETLSSRLDDSQNTLNASVIEEPLTLSSPEVPHVSTAAASTPQPSSQPLVAADLTATTQDLDTTLGSLKISTPLKANAKNQNLSSFSPRLLFSEKPGYNPKLSGSYCIQKNLVSPPRLSIKNITQSSWVAGGYWGHPVSPARDVSSHPAESPFSQVPPSTPPYPLSRSSSQSSGFVSQGSGPTTYRNQGPFSLPNSRHGSHCGEFDHGSVLSEPAYKTWGGAPTLYPSDSVSQCGRSVHPSQSKSDAQSLHSYSSAYSESLRYTPPSPIANSSFLYHTTHGNVSDTSVSDGQLGNGTVLEGKEGSIKSLTSTKYDQNLIFSCRNPWFAFFLGMSFAANGFLVALLCLRADIQMFLGS
ncbi:Transmembrane protein 201 [Portunus trituberculatus]|uniref:Transmembrane protein 201 n=1 Tax=Portunus trituberculatus TaxID=210409 RepID=A0A5B7DBF5_PORTR|nr:Transmembrane protein 201 [Portunus trituberculatus]